MPSSATVQDSKNSKGQVPASRFIVDEIRFDSSTHIPELDREQLITSLKRHDFGQLSDLIEGIRNEVLNNWGKRGYFQAMVRVEEESVGGDSIVHHVSVNVHVDEGLQYWLNELRFKKIGDDSGPPTFTQEELRKAFAMREGELFDADKIRRGLDALRRIYAAKGFIDFTSEPQTEVDQVRQRISLTLHLDEQTQFRVGHIEVLGLGPKLESLLRSKLRPGDIFNNESLEDFYEQNRTVLPPDARLRGDFKRNIKNATVDILFDFRARPCPSLDD